jgi:hypothetical protein
MPLPISKTLLKPLMYPTTISKNNLFGIIAQNDVQRLALGCAKIL